MLCALESDRRVYSELFVVIKLRTDIGSYALKQQQSQISRKIAGRRQPDFIVYPVSLRRHLRSFVQTSQNSKTDRVVLQCLHLDSHQLLIAFSKPRAAGELSQDLTALGLRLKSGTRRKGKLDHRLALDQLATHHANVVHADRLSESLILFPAFFSVPGQALLPVGGVFTLHFEGPFQSPFLLFFLLLLQFAWVERFAVL